jgi:hypothetical protein
VNKKSTFKALCWLECVLTIATNKIQFTNRIQPISNFKTMASDTGLAYWPIGLVKSLFLFGFDSYSNTEQ